MSERIHSNSASTPSRPIEDASIVANLSGDDAPLYDTPQTREKHAGDKLRQSILMGQFKPGERLDQAVIAKRLQLSLSPVREAIRTLAAEGLVTIYPHRGAFVTLRTPEEIEELHFIRAILEGAAIKEAVQQLTEQDLLRVESILHEADETSDFDAIQTLNHQFHQTLYYAARRPELLALILQLRNKVAPYIRLYLDAGMRNEAWASHRRIYEACVQRDAKLAEQLVVSHINQVKDGILASLYQH